MNFPPFWAKGTSGDFSVWRWSFQSVADAASLANQAAQQLADQFRISGFPPKHRGYYPDRPFREQILQEIKDETGQTCAVVTRNSYGCVVLNTARVMFVDIDLPEPKKPAGFLRKLFGKPEIAREPTPLNQALARVETWTRDHCEWGWRIYRTRSGLRLMATQALVDADSKAARDVFESLGADPLYRKLCETQKCFRARLTPKPWRCGMKNKPDRWPWLDSKQEARFQKWQAQYQLCCANWATCELIRHIGNQKIHTGVRQIIELHDATTRVDSKLQLA